MGSHDRLVDADYDAQHDAPRRPLRVAAVPVGVTIAALAALVLTTTGSTTTTSTSATSQGPNVPTMQPGMAAPRTSTSHASYAGSPSGRPRPSPSTVQGSSAAPAVVALTSFAYETDAPTPTAAATVHVVTRDTAPVTLVLHYAGGNSAGGPGDNAGLDDDFTLSGHTAYTITDTITALQYCYTRYFGVTASLKDTGLMDTSQKDTTAATTSFRQLASPACT